MKSKSSRLRYAARVLLLVVGKRRQLLEYLKGHGRYRAIIKTLSP